MTAAARYHHDSPHPQSVYNLSQEQAEFGVDFWVRRATIRDWEAQEFDVVIAHSCAQVLRPSWWGHVVNELSDLVVFVQEHECVHAVLAAKSLDIQRCAARVQHP